MDNRRAGSEGGWLFLGVLAVVIGVWLLVSSAGRIASLVDGDGYVGPTVRDGANVRKMLTNGPKSLWPDIAPWLLHTSIAVHVAALVGVVVVVWRWWLLRKSGGGLADRALPAGWKTTAQAAAVLRPGLDPKTATADDLGLAVGTADGQTVRATWEDTVIAIMAPRTGKSTSLAIPAIIEAPGPVIVTSNKNDLVATTSRWRARHRGRVWVFDPQDVGGHLPAWTWNPLAQVRSIDEAETLASHFAHVPNSGDPFWATSAQTLVASLLLAAAVSGEAITKVPEWIDGETDLAVGALADNDQAGQANKLSSLLAGPASTTGGIMANARTATRCLRLSKVAPWITPHPELPAFDTADFVTSDDTLYLMSEEGDGTTAPLVAAFVAEVIRTARRAARDTPGGRLDPPMVTVLDEAANICKIGDLPYLYSHLGSQGIVPITILQNRGQGRKVWGDDGFASLWSASTVKLVGPGNDEAAFCKELSDLIGTHEVPQTSQTAGGDGRRSQTTTLVERPLIAPSEIRALPKWHALAFGTGMPASIVKLRPWFESQHADELNTDIATGNDDELRADIANKIATRKWRR